MFLYFRNECLGEIQNDNKEGVWFYGSIIANENIIKYKDFLTALVNEEKEFKEGSFNEEWLNDDNWFIVDEHQNKKGIYLQAIHEDGEINWRYR
ncbi:hypothetical protein LHV56_21680 [Peribacillus frigoritolerans]|uniref:hypothetical protein n=1 Tax=Peribacillus frigoritolerans TaxID=450367 RepID=UPI00207A98BE|nr:hypothetical protein [Peribacillus frigoritolerans]USK79415.1 hypothetical protein LHV56_21680 [Peribacillus frigoritolerans]